MDVLPDDEEKLIQNTAREFFAAESTPARVRAAEAADSRQDPALWKQLAELGWIGIGLPEAHGGQGLPLPYVGLLLEEAGRHIAPVPLHSTLWAALFIARHGTPAQRESLREVVAGECILSVAVQGRGGEWSTQAPGLRGRVEGDALVLEGARSFVDNFALARYCLVLFTNEAGGSALAWVPTEAKGLRSEALVTTAKDSQALVHFDEVRLPLEALVGDTAGRESAARELLDLGAALMTSQLVGAARRDMEMAVEYARLREAFGQPIGAFQAIQHMAADMLIAVDGAELLVREALWRMQAGLPATIEVAQAKAFASDRCVFVARSAQQIHGGIGFMLEFDLQLWYRRIVAYSLRCGSVREHRRRVAAALLDRPGKVRLGMTQLAASA